MKNIDDLYNSLNSNDINGLVLKDIEKKIEFKKVSF